MTHEVMQNIYNHSPVAIQNAFVALKGYLLFRERYTGKYRTFLEELLAHEKRDDDWIRNYQYRTLMELLEYVSTHVPYYRSVFQKRELSTKDFLSIHDLKKLPILTKETLRKNSTRFLPDTLSKRKLRTIRTSGTTGKPLTIHTNAEARQRNYAFFSRFTRWTGCDERAKKATFGANLVVPQHQKKPPFWRYDAYQKNLLFSSFHLSEQNLEYYADKLLEYQPELIDAYPSCLFVVSRYLKKHGIVELRPRAIITSSEVLQDEWRRAIEDAFGCRIFDQYGCVEMCVFVGQCEAGRYHINPDYGIVEIVKNGENLPPGETGDIVCTGFVNRIMPLIRYNTGDVGSLSPEKCSCGRIFPLMNRIEGRRDEFIVTRDNRHISRLASVFTGFPIKASQIVQEDIDHIMLYLEKSDEYLPLHTDRIIKELQKRIGNDIDIEVIFATNLIEKADKFRAVVSRVK
jgi:phenylacetate-CoA ligase